MARQTKKSAAKKVSSNSFLRKPNLSIKYFNKKVFYAIFFTAIFLGIVFLLKTQLVVATVNGQPIYRTEVLAALEKHSGKQVLDSLITKNLLIQEAQKKGIVVANSDIENQFKTIENNITKSGQDFDSLLQLQGLTRDQLKENIKLQMLAEKMVSNNVSITDKEVQDYIDQNKNSLPQSTDEAQLKQDVRDQLKQQKINTEIQSLLQSIRQKAKIDYLFNY